MASNEIAIRDRETVVFFGDSITAQNLYAAFVETFLISRFPAKRLSVYNFGWGGHTTSDGNGRFARDAGPVKPTLVFTSFGGNDGKHASDREAYVANQRELARKIKAAGARQVLLTTSVVDYTLRHDKDEFNEILAGLADKLLPLSAELKLPSVDIFHPLRELQKKLKTADPAFTMIPDAAHPNAVGHLVLAYYILRQISAPREVGRIEIEGHVLRGAQGVRCANFQCQDGMLHFDLTLPFIPHYVPPEARAALQFVPYEEELNAFMLRVTGWDPASTCALVVDGNEKDATYFSAERLAAGIDLALVDSAPWVAQGRRLWELAQYRWKKHFEAWRELGFETRAEVQSLPALSKLIAAQKAYVSELGEAMRQVAQPRTYRVSLKPSHVLDLARLEVSPQYPYAAAEFEKRFPPETAPQDVAWTSVALQGPLLDLAKHFKNPLDCVAYARLRLETTAACRIHLVLGSDDGLTVFHDGKKLLARDVRRGCTLGDDELDVELGPGKNELLFRVTQFAGAYLLALRATVFGQARVRQVLP